MQPPPHGAALDGIVRQQSISALRVRISLISWIVGGAAMMVVQNAAEGG